IAPLKILVDAAVAANPQSPEPHVILGRFYRIVMEDDKALRCQENALRLDPDYAPALYERMMLRLRSDRRQAWRATSELLPGTDGIRVKSRVLGPQSSVGTHEPEDAAEVRCINATPAEIESI